jgi:hypothetical protein
MITMNTSILITAIRRSTTEGTYWYVSMAIMAKRTLPAYLVPCSSCQLKIGKVARVVHNHLAIEPNQLGVRLAAEDSVISIHFDP